MEMTWENVKALIEKHGPILGVIIAIIIVAFFAFVAGVFNDLGGDFSNSLGQQSACDHQWSAATCTHPQICVICDATRGSKTDHTWKAATCTDPKTCVNCGAKEGTVEHQWKAATYSDPKTCTLCNAVEGEKLKAEEVYINELIYRDLNCEHYGKIWTMGVQKPSYTVHTDVTSAEDYKDLNTRGHTTGIPCDLWGNRYTYGFHVDGPDREDYYIILDIEGKYTQFSGVYSMSPDLIGEAGKNGFQVWGDGRPIDPSEHIEMELLTGCAKTFVFDVSGVHELMIIYPKSSYKNRIATIFDGKLS